MAINTGAIQPLASDTTQRSETADKNSYGQILKSSVLIGGSSALNIAVGLVRTKTMAMLLGPSGFGLYGLYSSIGDLTASIAGMGVNSSGVRQIAEAASSGNVSRIAQTSKVLRRVSLLLGLLGAAALIAFSKQVSVFTFGGSGHSLAVCLVGIAVFLRLVSGGQAALIQGMRRISDLARMGVAGAVFGSALSIAIVYFLRDQGVAPSLVAVAAVTAISSWWYSRKLRADTPAASSTRIGHEAIALLKLGVAFMFSGLVMLTVAYGVRIIVLRTNGLSAAGLYQSAWNLGGLYVGFILQAMGADFYPRLTAHSADNPECNRLVNEQVLVGLLLAGPGAIATLTFAPLVISLLYSAKFAAAVGVLRWICLGATLQIMTWPLGFIILAKAKAGLLIFTEVAWGAVHLALAWFCITKFGVGGAGIAFFGSYIFHTLLVYPFAVRLSGFQWTSTNKRTSLIYCSAILGVFVASHKLPLFWATSIGALAVAASGAYSVRTLCRLMPTGIIPPRVRRIIAGLGLLPTPAAAG